jgi:hypothetical protein
MSKGRDLAGSSPYPSGWELCAAGVVKPVSRPVSTLRTIRLGGKQPPGRLAPGGSLNRVLRESPPGHLDQAMTASKRPSPLCFPDPCEREPLPVRAATRARWALQNRTNDKEPFPISRRAA